MRVPLLLIAGSLSAILPGPACGLDESPTPESPEPPSGEPTDPPSPPGVGTPTPPPAAPGAQPTPPTTGGPTPAPSPPGSPTPPAPSPTPPRPGTPSNPSTPTPPPTTTPPTPGEAGVTINGTFIPKDKVIVTLHLGHSNAAGRTDTPMNMRSMYFETNPKLWAYSKGGRFAPAKEPLSGDRLTQGRAGPGMAILHTAMEQAPGLTFVHIGRGHDGSVGGFCRSFRRGALLYDFVMDPAKELKGKVTFAGIFTMLGVNEFRRDNMNIPRFNECMAGIAADMRADLGDPNIPFIMGDLEDGARGPFDPSHPYSMACREQLRIASEKIPRAGLIGTVGLPMSDDHHYNLVGYKQWAERGFEIMKTKNLLPWLTPTPD